MHIFICVGTDVIPRQCGLRHKFPVMIKTQFSMTVKCGIIDWIIVGSEEHCNCKLDYLNHFTDKGLLRYRHANTSSGSMLFKKFAETGPQNSDMTPKAYFITHRYCSWRRNATVEASRHVITIRIHKRQWSMFWLKMSDRWRSSHYYRNPTDYIDPRNFDVPNYGWKSSLLQGDVPPIYSYRFP